MERRHRESVCKDDKGKHGETRDQGWTQIPTDHQPGTHSNRPPRFSGMLNNTGTTAGHNWNFGDSPPNHGHRIYSGLPHRQRGGTAYKDQQSQFFNIHQSSLTGHNPDSQTGAQMGKYQQSSTLSQLNHVQETSCADWNQNQRRGKANISQSSDSSTQTDASPTELTLVLVGRTGAGKSATGNTILGRKHFQSHLSPSLVTKTCKTGSATVQGRNLLVLDTPGVCNTLLSQDVMQKELQSCRKLFTAGQRSVLLLIVPLGRFTDNERQAIDTIQQLFSNAIPSRSILVFTHADRLGAESIQDFISRQNQIVQDLVERFSHRFVAINNKDSGDGSQVDQLLKMVDNPLKVITPLRLVLVGRMGAGKSATGNTILGRKHFQSHQSTSLVTKTCETGSATVQGRNLLVLDTPGVCNTLLSQDVMQQELQRCRELFTAGQRSVLLLIVPLGRFTENERQAVDTIQQLFSNEMPSRSILVFTHADRLVAESIQDFISRQNQIIQDLVERFSHRFVAINNRDSEDRSQVDQLLKMVDNLLKEITPLRLVLVGRTGAGKSATGNTILGRESFRSGFSMGSVTEECRREVGTVQGRDLVLIDTPGLFDTLLPPEVVQHEIVRCLVFCSPGPHVVLLTVRLGATIEEAWQSINLIEQMFQEEVRRHIILIFTHADQLEGNQIQDFIEQDPNLLELVDCFDGRYVAFNNIDTEDQSQVNQLLEMVDSLLAHNDYQFYTNNFISEIDRAVAELLLEARKGSHGRFQKFYRWCQSHPFIAASLALGAGAGLAMGAPLVVGAMAPAAVVTEVGIGAQLTSLLIAFGLDNVAVNAIVMKLAANGVLGGAGATATGAGLVGTVGAVISTVSCCIQ